MYTDEQRVEYKAGKQLSETLQGGALKKNQAPSVETMKTMSEASYMSFGTNGGPTTQESQP